MSWRAILLYLATMSIAFAEPIVVGSKAFAESYILAEVGAQLLESHGYDVDRRFGLNGTQIAFGGLENGRIDVYPEYTGTITEVILAQPELAELEEIRAALDARGFLLLDPFGFNNAYAIAASVVSSERLSLRKISDLVDAPPLRIALPHEFMNRRDGWPGLQAHYGFERDADGIEHSLAYEAINNDVVDIIAVYTSDGQIVQSDLVILEDDQNFFPGYLGAFLTRQEIDPDVLQVLEILSGRIDDQKMRELNLEVLNPSVSYAQIATTFLRDEGLISAEKTGPTALGNLSQEYTTAPQADGNSPDASHLCRRRHSVVRLPP